MREHSRSPLLRRRALERELAVRGAASVADLCQILGASAATIRRDLAVLEEKGALKRAYGGASARSLRPAEEALAAREHKHVEAKRLIACAALEQIKSGDTVFMNDGSTILALAREIAASDLDIFVATPAVNIPGALVNNRGVSICLLGGFIRPMSLATGGFFAEQMVGQINADLAFLSCDAFSAQAGMCFTSPEDAALCRAMMAKAQRCIALVHSAKFEWRARISTIPASDLDVLITERMPDDLAGELQRAGVEVIVAADGGPGRRLTPGTAA